jgi:uncharacterized protein
VKRLFQQEQRVPRPIDEVFAFFSDAQNLALVSPPSVKLTFLSKLPIEMRDGAVIDYRLWLGPLPLRWQSLISEWKPPFRFADEQTKGPYSSWLHVHSFESAGDETIIRDEIRYQAPGGFLEPLVHALFVGPQLEAIFRYRRKAIEAHFR